MGEASHPGPHNGPHSRIAVSAIDDGVSGLTYRKKPTGGRIYVRRNAFINKTGADSWDAFIQSTVRVCGTQLLLEIGSIPNMVDGAFVKNKPIWNSTTSGLPRYYARIKTRAVSGTRFWTLFHRYSSHVQVRASLLIQCAVCQGPGSKRCGRCRKIHYCSRAHQESHWPEHKLMCRTLAAFSMDPPRYPETQAELMCRSSSTDAPSFNASPASGRE